MEGKEVAVVITWDGDYMDDIAVYYDYDKLEEYLLFMLEFFPLVEISVLFCVVE